MSESILSRNSSWTDLGCALQEAWGKTKTDSPLISECVDHELLQSGIHSSLQKLSGSCRFSINTKYQHEDFPLFSGSTEEEWMEIQFIDKEGLVASSITRRIEPIKVDPPIEKANECFTISKIIKTPPPTLGQIIEGSKATTEMPGHQRMTPSIVLSSEKEHTMNIIDTIEVKSSVTSMFGPFHHSLELYPSPSPCHPSNEQPSVQFVTPPSITVPMTPPPRTPTMRPTLQGFKRMPGAFP
ncbi:hypothetical protein BDF14DRAFT_967360 [Spinellus fusiger]|nr:hypothetical protein BDF14DRAFT_967360 [Spinellus fusiger]